MFRTEFLIVLAATALTLGCATAPPSFPACSPTNSPNSICGLMNPEDLDFLPGREWVVVSQMPHVDREAEPGAPLARPGSLLAIRVENEERLTIFPASVGWDLSSSEEGKPTEGWGDADCPGAPSEEHFHPHGIHVGRHATGIPTLAVVNHGGREAVELFEIEEGDRPGLIWRGCVPLPEGVAGNDVALLSDGGFVVTKFSPPMEGMGVGVLWTGLKISAGWNTGAVYRWSSQAGFQLVPDSEGSAPNGIAISKDESEIFVSQWGEMNVYRMALDPAGREREEVELEHRPDNLTWTEAGKLLVAGQAGSLSEIVSCGEVSNGSCALDYGVYSIDPSSLDAELLFTGRGAASVALEVGDDIYVGNFSGDQVERVTRPR